MGHSQCDEFASTYAYIFMDERKIKLLESQKSKPLVWLRYIEDVFFTWAHGKEKFKKFLNNFNLPISLIKKAFLSWILKVSLSVGLTR